MTTYVSAALVASSERRAAVEAAIALLTPTFSVGVFTPGVYRLASPGA